MTTRLLEQLLSSGGNFIFFLISANLQGAYDFGEFAVIWAGVQLVQAVTIQWILLPITSVSIHVDRDSLIAMAREKVYAISIFAIVCIWSYLKVMEISFDLTLLTLIWFFAISLSIYEIARHFFIRYFKIILLLKIQALKILLMYFLLFAFEGGYIDVPYNISLMAFSIPVVALSLMLIGMRGLMIWQAKSKNKMFLSSYSKPMLLLSVANNVQTLILIYVLSQRSMAVYGAMQAFRSAANFLPFVLQFMETHVAAYLVSKGESALPFRRMHIYALAVPILILGVVLLYYLDDVVKVIYGLDYVPYSYVLPIVITIVLLQSYGRLIGVNVRLQGDTGIFNFSSLILFISSIALLIAYNNVNWVFSVLIATAFIQALAYAVWYRRSKARQ